MPVATRSSPAPASERRTRLTNAEAHRQALTVAQQYYEGLVAHRTVPATRTTRASPARPQEGSTRTSILEANRQALQQAQLFYEEYTQNRSTRATSRASSTRMPEQSDTPLTISEANQQAVDVLTLLSDQPALPDPPLRSPSRNANRRTTVAPSEEAVQSSSKMKKKTPTRRAAQKKENSSPALPVRSSPRLRRQNLAPNEVELNPNDATLQAVAELTNHSTDPMPTTPIRSPARDRRLKSSTPEEHQSSQEVDEHKPSIASRVKSKRNVKTSVANDPSMENSVLSHLPRAPVFDLPRLSSTGSRLKIKSTKGEPLVLPRPPSSHSAPPTIASIIEADPVPSMDASSFQKPSVSSGFSWLFRMVSLYFVLVLIVYFFHYNSLPPMDSMTEPISISLDAGLSLEASTMDAVEGPTMVMDEL